jgi:hypothetical protein
MPKIAKIIVAAVLIILGVASMGMVGIKDLRHRPEYCAGCHKNPHYSSWESSDYLAHNHAKFAISCQRCHPQTIHDSLEEIKIYTQEGYRPSSIGKRTPDEMCLSCHNNEAAIVERTKDYLIDGENHNPHDPHAGIAETSEAPDSIECYRCHTMHQESPGLDYCYGCHHTYEFISCNSSGCHDESESGGF